MTVEPISDERLAEIRKDAKSCDRICRGFDCEPADILALLARLDKAEAGWQVKPLEWNEYETEGDPDRWDAETLMGSYYEIAVDFNGYLVSHDYADFDRAHDTLEAAKAAAQADYEARIRSYLLPPPPSSES